MSSVLLSFIFVFSFPQFLFSFLLLYPLFFLFLSFHLLIDINSRWLPVYPAFSWISFVATIERDSKRTMLLKVRNVNYKFDIQQNIGLEIRVHGPWFGNLYRLSSLVALLPADGVNDGGKRFIARFPPVARPRRAGYSLSRFGEYYFAYIEMRVVHAATELWRNSDEIKPASRQRD